MPRRTKSPPPISLRLTENERERLEAEAGVRTLSSLIRERLFGEDARGRKIRLPSVNAERLGRILAILGQSDIAASLRDLAEAARIGALPLTPETEAALTSACASIDAMRSDLVHALGLIDQAGR